MEFGGWAGREGDHWASGRQGLFLSELIIQTTSQLPLHPDGEQLEHRGRGPRIATRSWRRQGYPQTLPGELWCQSGSRGPDVSLRGVGVGRRPRSQATSEVNGQAWPQAASSTAPASHHRALQPAVAKGRGLAGITCKRSRPSCQGRSGGRLLQEPPPAAVLPRRPR